MKPPEFAQLVTLDFETYYSKEYSLRGNTTDRYVRDERFEVIGCAVKVNGQPATWMEEPEFRAWVRRQDWSTTAALAHNASFDLFVLSERYGAVPGFIFDTLSMARPLHGVEVGGSLAKLSAFYGVGEKGREVDNAKGKRRADFTQAEWDRYGEYSKNDAELAYRLLHKMLAENGGFPESEIWLIDTTLRLFVDPKLVLDQPLLAAFLVEEQKRKADLLASAETPKSVFMSNEKFAELLRSRNVEPPMKISPTTGKLTYAFAKSDPGMQALLEDENDEIRLFAEVRVGVKSTINESRTEGLLKVGEKPFGMQLKYCGAHTGRWSGSGGMNVQNLPRVQGKCGLETGHSGKCDAKAKGAAKACKAPVGGHLRRSLLAPPGHVVVVADLSQIEARVLQWLSGAEDVLGMFRRNDLQTQAYNEARALQKAGRPFDEAALSAGEGDFYSEAGSPLLGKKLSKKETPDERQVAKGLCWAPETPVLTRRGWVPISLVAADDLVWDGVEWVAHAGSIEQGEKEVWEANSVAATPDHEILTGLGWRPWSAVLTNRSLFQSALDSVALPSSIGNSGLREIPAGPWGGIPSAAAIAAGRARSLEARLRPAGLLSATGARSGPAPEQDTSSTSRPCQRESTELVYLIDGPLVSDVVITQSKLVIRTTAAAEFSCVTNGGQTRPHSSATSAPCRGGTSLSSNSTESTTTADMSRETLGSSAGARTCSTGARSGPSSNESTISKRRTQTYDLVSCGPRHRFTVLTSAGPVLAHNCLGLGFQMGWKRLAAEELKGMLGTPPVQFLESDARVHSVDVESFARYRDNMAKIENMASRLTLPERVVHCAVSDFFVRRYRSLNPGVVSVWDNCQDLLDAMTELDEDHPGHAFGPNDCMKVRYHAIELPNGLRLKYPGLSVSGSGYSYMEGKKRKHIYGGLLTENIVQALARIVIAGQMLELREQGVQLVSCTHDEAIAIALEAEGQKTHDLMISTMRKAPTWCAGIPLNAEGGFHKSYGLCK